MTEFKLFKRAIQTLDVVVEPLDPAVQQAVQKIRQLDPVIFKNVTKIVVHSGGGGGQLGHVAKGPGQDPHVIHLFKDRISEIVKKQYRDINDPKALQDSISLALIEVIAHEAGHIGKLRTEEQVEFQPFFGEGEAENVGQQMAQRAKALFPKPTIKPLAMNQVYLSASLALDHLRNNTMAVPMTEPNLSFMVRVANKDVPNIVKEGLNLLGSDIVTPAAFEIEDAIEFNKEAIKNPKTIRVISIIQDKVGHKDYSSKDFIFSLAQVQSWMGLEPNGKLDESTVSKFNQPSKNLPRNFGVVTPGSLYRGGIIENENQLKVLKDMFGVERVISLHKDKNIPEMCKALEVEYVEMPLEEGKSDEEGRMLFNDNVAKILEEKPTYVHCLFGQDRTGGVIARYRTEKGWPCQLAYAEAKAYGFQDKFSDMIDWFCEPAKDKPPVDTKKIRSLLKTKEQNCLEAVPTDVPFGNSFDTLRNENYLSWTDSANGMSLAPPSTVANRINTLQKNSYYNNEDALEEIEEDLDEESQNILANLNGLRGDVKPEEPWGGFSADQNFLETKDF